MGLREARFIIIKASRLHYRWTSCGQIAAPNRVCFVEYARGFVVLCFVVLISSLLYFLLHSCDLTITEVFFNDIMSLPWFEWINTEWYGQIKMEQTATKLNKAQIVYFYRVPSMCLLELIILNFEGSMIARFMGPPWGPSGADRTQVGPMLAPWTLLSGSICVSLCQNIKIKPTKMYIPSTRAQFKINTHGCWNWHLCIETGCHLSSASDMSLGLCFWHNFSGMKRSC